MPAFDFQKILIVRTDRIGDVVLTTPVLRALRQAYPRAQLSVLLSPLTQDLLLGHPDIDEVLVDDKKGRHRGPLGYGRLVADLRARHFDLAINFHTKKRTNLLCFLAGIPRRLGYCNEKFGFLLTDRLKDRRPEGKQHEAEYCLDVLKPLCVERGQVVPRVSLQPAAEQWAGDYCAGLSLQEAETLVAVHPGASCPTKKWPAESFTQLIDQVQRACSCRVVLIGAADNRAVADQIRHSVRVPVCDLTGQTTVAQLASFLKNCHLLISNDSGPVHLADALGCRVVSIFTRNQPGINPQRWRPLGIKSRFVAPLPQVGLDFSKGEVLNPDFLFAVGVKEVWGVVDEVLKLC